MARSSGIDTVETFRFDVRIISVSLAPGNLANNFKGGSVTQFSRVGFTDVTTPEFSNNVMEYRENTDNFYVRKIPGLGRFNDIVLSRGVLAAPSSEGLVDPRKDFYRWVTRVNSPNPALSTINEFANTSQNAILRQSENYRKDMVIILRDREGKAARRWYILNAFPVNYKGSTDLNASTEQKAIESLTITYELAFELPSIADAAKEFIANLTDSPFADIADDLDLDFGL
jgi:phage tail-like protein